MTRRERFRSYMASVDPATNPLTAIERGFYVKPPGAIANQIVGRLEIEPTARQLIVGGIGSGKTTQLLVSARILNELPDIVARYVDVSSHQDLGAIQPGCLVAMASSELLGCTEGIDEALSSRISGWLRGYEDPYDGYCSHEPPPDWVPGILSPPEPDWPHIEPVHIDDLKAITASLLGKGRHPVVFFDSMDRMSDYAAFSAIVAEDVAAFRDCGVGVVLVGPLRSLEGFGRIDADRFDHLHLQPPIDVRRDPVGCEFLEHVLERRAVEELLPAEARSALVRWSGGVLRDLMSLAKLAGEEAYLDGGDTISMMHTARAANRFGRSLLMGLQEREIEKLKEILGTGRFVQVSPSDVALVATRRVLAYDDQTGAYAVHPTIAPLLEDIGSVA